MSDALSTADIKKRSLSGVKWLFVTNVFGISIAYAIALLLGRTGPDALGAYALARIFIDVITTFTLFGGPVVLRNFLPKVSNAEQRGRFAVSYSLILMGLMVAALILFYIFPGILEFLLQQKFNRDNYVWFVVLTFVVVTSECLMGITAGLMQIKLAAIARLIVRMVLLPIIGVFFLFDRVFLSEYATEILLSGFFVAYVTSAVLCIIGIWHDRRFHLRFGWYLPSGFGRFSFTSTAAMLFFFLYTNFDRMCVLGISDLKGLGLYQAVLSLALVIEAIPKMISTAFVPMFSSLLASKKKEAILRAYALTQRVGSTAMFIAAVLIISFSSEFLSIFGSGYSKYNYLLAIFCVKGVFTSLFLGNTAVLTSYEKNAFRFTISFFQILLQIAITLIFLDSYGILAIASAKVLASIFAQGVSIAYVVLGLKEGFQIPRTYWVACVVSISAALIRTLVLPEGLLISTMVFFLSLLLFWFQAGLTINECKSTSALLFKHT